MNEKNIAEAFKRTREAVNARKAKGDKSLLLVPLYWSWPDINLADDEKEQLIKLFEKEGWKLENAFVDEGHGEQERIVLFFEPNDIPISN